MSGRRTTGRPTAVLGIETSCDETAAAVVVDGREVWSSVVSSQIDLHARYGGVVPEIASRAHLGSLVPVVAEAMVSAGVEASRIDAVAATVGPGLIGALLIGVSTAKALALAWDVPFVAVNHLEAHLHAVYLEHAELELPVVVLLVSGGHTMLVRWSAPGRYEVLGRTIDDAAGEAFDKVARFLGLGYPGGPAIDALSVQAEAPVAFPRPLLDGGFDFSFSGLKTAVINHVRKHPEASTVEVAAGFQEAVVDVLVAKLRAAAAATGARGVCIGGGVAANSMLRDRVRAAAEADGLAAYLPSRAMCTDNAAMVAAAGWYRLEVDGPSSLEVGAEPNLGLERLG